MIGMIITIVIIYMMYYFWIAFNFDKRGEQKPRGKAKKKNAKILKKKMPSEIELFVNMYNVDLDKINYRYFLQLMGLIIACDLSLTVTIMDFINKLWLKLLVGFIAMIIIVLISYKLLGNYFKKRGLLKNEDNRRNRKKVAKNMGR